MNKWMEYCLNSNVVTGQITRNGTLLLIESDLEEIDFLYRPVRKNNWTIRMFKGKSIETIELKNVPLNPTAVDLFTDGTILIYKAAV
ncbi:hypothetical protein [Cytobacillus purgationiresistens]|uniref:Uncharacterized protein n=1 Tax=Cytobacillus purgationiresistens TaxID=863449 RepID=A0ABU0ACN1_9BACI|nr:hypothetical protein [Cytobacillus purgationiresistens]MDQ0268476.1 hypothetical protein [Cytobacillus purgationiresistens]